jgi:Glycosyl hydrolase family 26
MTGHRKLLVASFGAAVLGALGVYVALNLGAQSRALAVTCSGQPQGGSQGYMKGSESIFWAPAPGAPGYDLCRDGTKVSSAGSSATSAKFSVTSGTHTLLAFAQAALPPPTTTTVSTTSATTTIMPTTTPTTTAPSSNSIYWGAYIEGAQTYSYLYGGSWENAPWCDPGYQCARPRFASNVGKAPSLEHWGQCNNCSFDAGIASVVVARGDIPSIDWTTPSSNDAAVAAGTYDAQLLTMAKAIAAFGHPIFLEPDVEMNGTWYGYSPGVNGNTAADFIAMWRHVHDLFVSAGATNVTWVFAPNVDPNHVYTPIASLYPGDAYVDWTGLDGYNWGSNAGDPWLSFAQIFGPSYSDLQAITSKPVMVNEVASEEAGGDKAAWITNTLTQLPQAFPNIKAFQWFNWRIFEKNVWWSWEVESSSASQQAFANAIGSSYYAPGGTFNILPLGSKIQPLP